MSKKQGGKMSGRLIYLATIVAIFGVTGGVAMGTAILAPTTVTQTAGMYSGANAAPVGYAATPTLSISNTPTGVAACSGSTVTESASGGTTNVYLSFVSGATNCTAGHFAELFTVAYSATIGAVQTDKFTVTTSWGVSPTTGFNSVSISTGASGSPWTQTIDVYVDYGSPSMPAGGISTLTLVIQ